MFYIYIAHEGKHYKLMIDGGSCANLIAKAALEKIGLKAEPHPNPHNVNGLIRLLNLLLSVVRSLPTCLAMRIMFGVMS